MSDWQWFEEFEQAALAQGDRQRANLRQIHREAYSFSEIDPDRALALLAEGRRLAQTLQEPWWVLLFDHWQVHLMLYDKCDYRTVLEPAVRNVLQVRKLQYTGFPQRLWILGDLIQIYVNLDPRGYADEIEQSLAELEADLPPQLSSARCLFWFHQLDAAANQGRVDDAFRIALRIRAAAQADPVASTGKHYLVPCYRFLCHFHSLRQDWSEVATWAKEGQTLAEELAQKQPVAVFQMWQAVVSQQRGEPDEAARLFRLATSRMGHLRSPPERDYYDAMCAYHELCGDMEKSLQVRTQQIQDFKARGKVYDEFEARQTRLRLLVQMGRPLEPHLSDARAVARKFRRSECYLPLIEQIATSANGPLGEI